jgi:streptomycin 6-kinase
LGEKSHRDNILVAIQTLATRTGSQMLEQIQGHGCIRIMGADKRLFKAR